VGTSSFDTSWRLWDVESCRELLLQESGRPAQWPRGRAGGAGGGAGEGGA
jgi:hypothetical protein